MRSSVLKRTLRKPTSAAEAFEERIEQMAKEGKNDLKENQVRKAEKKALHEAIDEQLEQREGRMMEAILQGNTEKLWGLIAAAIENGFIAHLGLNREEASKMRGRNVVRIRANDGSTLSQKDDREEEKEEQAVDGKNKKKRWLSRAGKHAMQANRLINIARRMQVPPSLTNEARKKANDENNEDTLRTYIKEAAR